MALNAFTPAVIRKYFEHQLPEETFRNAKCVIKCPFHQDNTPSLALDLDKGVWFCHACAVGGGMVDFEKKFTECSDGEAWVNISAITGLLPSGQRPERVYVYEDEFARPLFRVVRYPKDADGKKKFQQQSFNSKGGWDTNNSARKVLYHLPEVITCNEVFICEGEKDCDRIRGLSLAADRPDIRITATTNPGGAGKWDEGYSKFLAGKRAFVISDNDDIGRTHAERVAESVSKYAVGVKVIHLPGLPEKGDASDYLDSHSGEEFIAFIRSQPIWKAKDEAEDDGFFVGAAKFSVTVPDEIDWMIKPLIPRGWNGFVVADPKSLKSYSAVDLLIHLALGKNWMGFYVPRPVKVAILAREDYFGLTAWRIKHFVKGMFDDRKITLSEAETLNDWMVVNTQQQAGTWYLNDDADLDRIIRNLKQRKTEFVMMDVFRTLFEGDENDNQQMQTILDRVKRIRREVGCGLGIVHHANKSGLGSIFQRTRGASAIHGFMEWGIGITTENPDDDRSVQVRKVEFLTKAGQEPDPIFIKAHGGETEGWIKLLKVESQAKPKAGRPRDLISQTTNRTWYEGGEE